VLSLICHFFDYKANGSSLDPLGAFFQDGKRIKKFAFLPAQWQLLKLPWGRLKNGVKKPQGEVS